jgi:hypothetical protein
MESNGGLLFWLVRSKGQMLRCVELVVSTLHCVKPFDANASAIMRYGVSQHAKK